MVSIALNKCISVHYDNLNMLLKGRMVEGVGECQWNDIQDGCNSWVYI
jgi:hypothetical protein